jgi:hypothetical protein
MRHHFVLLVYLEAYHATVFLSGAALLLDLDWWLILFNRLDPELIWYQIHTLIVSHWYRRLKLVLKIVNVF